MRQGISVEYVRYLTGRNSEVPYGTLYYEFGSIGTAVCFFESILLGCV